jgi:hypothetical protein
MAKDSDSLAGGFDAESTGGVLSGFLAEEDEFDRRALWRLGSWGVASVGAVVIAFLANQSSIGARREQIASTDLARQSQQLQSIAKETQNEARRLGSAIETLNNDRDRLFSRVAGLEQGLESVTGAIARQNPVLTPPQPAMPAAAAAPASSSPAPAGVASTNPMATATSPTAPPTVSSPATAPAATAATGLALEMPATAQKPAPAATSLASQMPATAQKPAPAATTAAVNAATTAERAATGAHTADKPVANGARSEPATATTPAEAQASANGPASSLVASKSMMAPPDPAAGKLTEPSQPPKIIMAAPIPEVLASVPPDEEAMEQDAVPAVPRLAVQRTEFGVDVGTANSIPGLRALWRGLIKSKSNAALTTLRPIIAIKEGINGLGIQLRLVAGPISDAAAAAKICAAMIASDRPCTTTVFEGQRLALNPDEAAPAEAKPATQAKPVQQKRSAPKRPVATEEPAPKPEPSTLSTIFSRHQ